MDYDKLIENAKVCCGDIDAEDCTGRCINPHDKRGEEVRFCRQWLIRDLYTAIETLRADLDRVTAEGDAAVADMEALMWFSGEGCRICAHAVEIHKGPYVRLDCDREIGIDCQPKWRGIKKED